LAGSMVAPLAASWVASKAAPTVEMRAGHWAVRSAGRRVAPRAATKAVQREQQ